MFEGTALWIYHAQQADKRRMGRETRPGKEKAVKLIDADLLIEILEMENEEGRHRRTKADEEIREIFRNKVIELLQKTEAAVGWHDMEKKKPADDEAVLVNVSGANADGTCFCDHAIKIGSYLQGEGWLIFEDLVDYTVHQWCEIPEGYDLRK